jgi:uncharacterized Zn-finger protein
MSGRYSGLPESIRHVLYDAHVLKNVERTSKMQPAEIIHVETATVGCDGGGGPLGHPLVYLPIGHSGQTDCPYCGRRFILDHSAKAHDHA